MAGIHLTFDGIKMRAVDSTSGAIIRSWDAISGRPGKQAAEFQNQMEVGPIPQGGWSFSTSIIIDMADLPLWRQWTSETGLVSPAGGVSSWGNTFVRLSADEDTQTFGRGSIYIHGGDQAGSAGCIDLVGGNDSFFDYIKSLSGEIQLIVDYSGNEEQLQGSNHPLLNSNVGRDESGLSSSEILGIAEQLYQNDPEAVSWFINQFSTRCFLAGTMIDMWPLDIPPNADLIYDEKELLAKVWKKPIEEITQEDWVVSYDEKGRLKPGRVTHTFQNHSKHILDVHGLMVTPGHATYCAKVEGEENRFADNHVPIIDILRSDGALKKNDGTLVRAATDCVVGSKDDEQFWAFLLYEDKDGNERVRDKCQVRLGTRWMMPNGSHFSMREYMNSIGVELIEEGPQKGYVRFKETGLVTVFAWMLSETLPKPEDYVLQRSQVTLQEIYEADEWEAVGPQTPAPFMGEAGQSYNQNTTSDTGLYASAAASDHLPPNIPHSMRNSPNQPTMSRKQRRALEAKQRKGGKQPKRAQTVH